VGDSSLHRGEGGWIEGRGVFEFDVVDVDTRIVVVERREY
jgi:hypothetical protein